VRLKIGPDYDYKEEFQKLIAQVLKEIKGQDSGVNANEWRQWLEAHKGSS
jgi:hypothetical protein